jgi:HNH endonuclease
MAIKRCPADAAFSAAVRMSRNHTCEHCKRTDGKMECAHIYGRRAKSVRWDTLNVLCLCHTCHRYFTANPLDFDVWLKRYLGQGYLDILNEKRRKLFKTTKSTRAEVAKHYREQIKLLEAGPHDLVSYQ